MKHRSDAQRHLRGKHAAEASPAPISFGGLLSSAWLPVAILCCTAAVLLRLAYACSWQLTFPYDIVYESPNLATVRLIQAGKPVYAASTYDAPPFVLTMYPPLYHALVAWLPQSPSNPFLTGRLVATASILSTAAIFFLIGPVGRSLWWPCLAVGLLFGIRPIVSNTPYFRHDMLGILFAVVAMVLLSHGRSRRMVVLAAVAAAAAVATKQSFLTSGAACLAFLAMHDGRMAGLFAGVYALLVGAVVVASATWLGDPAGVWFSWLVAPRNPLVPEHFLANGAALLRQPTFVAIALVACGTILHRLRTNPSRTLGETPFAAALLIALPAALVTSSKDGAAVNSYFEVIVFALLWSVHWVGGTPFPERAGGGPATAVAALCIAMVSELCLATPIEYCMVGPHRARAVAFHLGLAARQLAGTTTDPRRVLNLTEDGWATYGIGNTAHLNDPLLYTILFETDVLSVEPLCASIRRRDYDLILLPLGDPPKWLARSPWERVLDAVAERYQRHANADRMNDTVGVIAYFVPKP